jgi:hypothetical protein
MGNEGGRPMIFNTWAWLFLTVAVTVLLVPRAAERC